MNICRFATLFVLCLALSVVSWAQGTPAHTLPAPAVLSNSAALGGGPADQPSEPKLEHFNPNLVDKDLDPCNDFYKYSCSKWMAANPIPPDQAVWDTGSDLQVWNETSAARNAGSRQHQRSQT